MEAECGICGALGLVDAHGMCVDCFDRRDPDRPRGYYEQYYLTNRDRLIAYRKQYYQDHKAKALVYQRQYYLDHTEEAFIYQRLYLKGERRPKGLTAIDFVNPQSDNKRVRE